MGTDSEPPELVAVHCAEQQRLDLLYQLLHPLTGQTKALPNLRQCPLLKYTQSEYLDLARPNDSLQVINTAIQIRNILGEIHQTPQFEPAQDLPQVIYLGGSAVGSLHDVQEVAYLDSSPFPNRPRAQEAQTGVEAVHVIAKEGTPAVGCPAGI